MADLGTRLEIVPSNQDCLEAPGEGDSVVRGKSLLQKHAEKRVPATARKALQVLGGEATPVLKGVSPCVDARHPVAKVDAGHRATYS